MSASKQALLILITALAAGFASAFLHPLRPPWYSVKSAADLRWRISLDQAKAISVSREIVWIDARDRIKYNEEHLPGAILLNSDEWGELMFEQQDALQSILNQTVIVYCDGEKCERSSEVAERLRELLGVDPVYVLDGDWREMLDSR